MEELTPNLLEELGLPPEGTEDLSVQSFGDLNKIIVRYKDTTDLKRIEELIEKLDKLEEAEGK